MESWLRIIRDAVPKQPLPHGAPGTPAAPVKRVNKTLMDKIKAGQR